MKSTIMNTTYLKTMLNLIGTIILFQSLAPMVLPDQETERSLENALFVSQLVHDEESSALAVESSLYFSQSDE